MDNNWKTQTVINSVSVAATKPCTQQEQRLSLWISDLQNKCGGELILK